MIKYVLQYVHFVAITFYRIYVSRNYQFASCNKYDVSFACFSGVKKNMPAPPEAKMAEKKRKLDDSAKKEPDNERKSTGIALLGSYDDDSSDED